MTRTMTIIFDVRVIIRDNQYKIIATYKKQQKKAKDKKMNNLDRSIYNNNQFFQNHQ